MSVRLSDPRWRSLCREDLFYAVSVPFAHRGGTALTDGHALLWLRGVRAPAVRRKTLHALPTERSVHVYLAPPSCEPGHVLSVTALYEFCGSPALTVRPPRRCEPCGGDGQGPCGGQCRSCAGTGDSRAYRKWTGQIDPISVVGVTVNARLLGRCLAGALEHDQPRVVRASASDDHRTLLLRARRWTIACMAVRFSDPADVRRFEAR